MLLFKLERLRGTPNENGEWGRKKPLQSDWDSGRKIVSVYESNIWKYIPVGILVVAAVVVVGNATNNDTANSPEHLQHLGSRSTQSQRHDFRAIGGGIRNEDTPWHALENLGCEHHGK